MRLLLSTVNRTYGAALVVVVALWAGVFYAVLRHRIGEEVNERLLNRTAEIAATLRTAPPGVVRAGDFVAWPAPGTAARGQAGAGVAQAPVFSDSTGWEPLDHEIEPYRVLHTHVGVAGRGHYYLRVSAALAGTEKLVSTVLLAVGGLLLSLGLTVGLLNHLVLARLWQPFYQTLAWLQRFRVEAPAAPADGPAEAPAEAPLAPNAVLEFAELRRAIGQLAIRSQQAYREQKQFTENAAHELQTPLAVAGGQIETLLQHAALTAAQADGLHALSQTLGRMARLNRALLLLARLDNGQVGPPHLVALAPVVAELLEELTPAITARALRVVVAVPAAAGLLASPDLVPVLVGNLLRNAVLHNQPEGWLAIRARPGELTVENTGPPLPFSPETAFRRFAKGGAATSTGLGLALVARIAARYGLHVRYTTTPAGAAHHHLLVLSGPALR